MIIKMSNFTTTLLLCTIVIATANATCATDSLVTFALKQEDVAGLTVTTAATVAGDGACKTIWAANGKSCVTATPA